MGTAGKREWMEVLKPDGLRVHNVLECTVVEAKDLSVTGTSRSCSLIRTKRDSLYLLARTQCSHALTNTLPPTHPHIHTDATALALTRADSCSFVSPSPSQARHAYARAHTHAHTRAHTYAYTNTHTHTLSRTHTHTQTHAGEFWSIVKVNHLEAGRSRIAENGQNPYWGYAICQPLDSPLRDFTVTVWRKVASKQSMWRGCLWACAVCVHAR